MNFAKFQATGNDFVVIDVRRSRKDWSELARRMCHRRFGVGADGLILILPSRVAELKMRMFNPDGSEAHICGNGLRCLAKYAFEKRLVTDRTFRVETLAGIRSLHVILLRDKVKKVRVDMGTPIFAPEDIPVTLNMQKLLNTGGSAVDIMPILDYPLELQNMVLPVSIVSIGNPHAVAFLDQPVDSYPLDEVGPEVENHPLFPARTNFEIARVLNRTTVEVRVWERGAGETLSCGSGACAVAVLADRKGLVDSNRVDIIFRGGQLSVSQDIKGEIFLEGPVEEVFVGEWLR